MKQVITIEGMSCQHCVAAVTEALQKLADVQQVSVDLAAGQATIEAAAPLPQQTLRDAIEDTGFDVLAIN